MATKFLEAGGNATFNVATTANGGFWGGVSAAVLGTDFAHNNQPKSIKFPSTGGYVITPNGVVADAGARISFWAYINALPGSTARIMDIDDVATFVTFSLQLTSAGVLQASRGSDGTQIGSNGSTVPTSRWFRISIAYTITDGTHNRIEVFFDGVPALSITNASINRTGTNNVTIGNISGSTSLDMRGSDFYIDDSNALTDPGNICVTAKRPYANGTTNNFDTQIGSGNSGYGSGHADEVNERALDTASGWSKVGAGSAITEEYNIELPSRGDIDLVDRVLVDYMGWVYAKALISETAQIVLNSVASNISLTGSNAMFTKAAGSTSYPAGSGADIGIITSTDVTTVSLYECGIMVAYIYVPGAFGNYAPYVKTGVMNRSERAT